MAPSSLSTQLYRNMEKASEALAFEKILHIHGMKSNPAANQIGLRFAFFLFCYNEKRYVGFFSFFAFVAQNYILLTLFISITNTKYSLFANYNEAIFYTLQHSERGKNLQPRQDIEFALQQHYFDDNKTHIAVTFYAQKKKIILIYGALSVDDTIQNTHQLKQHVNHRRNLLNHTANEISLMMMMIN